MKVIFGLYDQYEDARSAVKALLEDEFDPQEMNVIVLQEIAKNHLEVDLDVVSVAVTDEVGERTVSGLDRLLGGEQPVKLPGMEDVYAAGSLATIVARTAAAPGEGGLKAALADFTIPEPVAEAFQVGVGDGGLLFWIRVPDERAARAVELLRLHHGQHVADYSG